MNFDEAIKVYSGWKVKLRTCLRNPDGSLSASTVGLDDKCPLGVWIHGEGAKFVSLPEYAVLKSGHAVFHRAAADVIRKADANKDVNEDIDLGGSIPFSDSSSKVVQAILKMRTQVE